jgi:hypothetical protein
MVSNGDPIFIWRSGRASAGGGLFARAEATGRATPARNPPWPDGDRYSYTFPINVTAEIDVPVGDNFPGNKTSVRFGLQNIWVTWGFWHLPDEVTKEMNSALHRR